MSDRHGPPGSEAERLFIAEFLSNPDKRGRWAMSRERSLAGSGGPPWRSSRSSAGRPTGCCAQPRGSSPWASALGLTRSGGASATACSRTASCSTCRRSRRTALMRPFSRFDRSRPWPRAGPSKGSTTSCSDASSAASRARRTAGARASPTRRREALGQAVGWQLVAQNACEAVEPPDRPARSGRRINSACPAYRAPRPARTERPVLDERQTAALRSGAAATLPSA